MLEEPIKCEAYPLNILQLNYFDNVGGAARISWYLFNRYRQLGHDCRLAVGIKTTEDPDVFEIPNDSYRNLWAGFWSKAEKYFLKRKFRFLPGGARLMAAFGEPRRWKERREGIEDFHFPATPHLFSLSPVQPDIFHAHNLHGYHPFFDLRALPSLSRQVPTVITLHDEWMMTGHCAYTLGCERWRIGCGQCPDLTIYPSIEKDATCLNSLRKKKIYQMSRLFVATPSKWLMDRAKNSILRDAMTNSRVIHNGVDLAIFHPGDRFLARQFLNLPADGWIVLFVGHLTHSHRFKDYSTVKEAFLKFSQNSRDTPNILVCVGEEGTEERTDNASIRFIGYQNDMRKLAEYYRSADVLTHAAHIDNFPNTVLEAMACGTPVIGTAVGGVPEQIEDGTTGFLVPAADPPIMAARLAELKRDNALQSKMAYNCSETARRRFGIDRMAEAYLAWYQEILDQIRYNRTSIESVSAGGTFPRQ